MEVSEDEDGHEVAKRCKCAPLRDAHRKMSRSGLGDLLNTKTFDNYEVTNGYQKAIRDSAIEYVDEFLKGNKYSFAILGQSGCVDAETEYFNGIEWVEISNYKGEDVLQYDPETKTASLTKPSNYIVKPADKLYKLKTMRGSINQVLSADHDFAYITSKGNMRKKKFEEVMKLHKENVQGFYGKVETAFNYSGEGIDLTEKEIRLMVAIIADGHFRKDLNLCSINISKERKIIRLRALLKGIDHKEYEKNDGMTEFRFYAPRREKEFTSYWYNCNREQLKIIEDEIFRWDGHINDKGSQRFDSTSKESADFVQFMLSSLGMRATISLDERHGYKTCYIVRKSQGNSTVSMVSTGGRNKPEIIEVKPKDNKQYCFTVDTGYLVLRRRGRIFITGNCGKTHITTAIAKKLLDANVGVKYFIGDEITQNLQACKYDEENYNKEFNKIISADVLVIDDLFKSSITNYYKEEGVKQEDLREIFKVINYRYNKNLPIILNSEIHFERFTEIDQAIIGRVSEMCNYKYLLSIKPDAKKNYRLNARSF